jgi:predicted nuclease of predicted toxin-antitoxin system
MKFFMDECVPDSVGKALQEAGHEVIFLRDVIAKGSPDEFVAKISEILGAILVTHDSDFRAIASRFSLGQSKRKTLSRVSLGSCQGPKAVSRIREALSLIEHEWVFAQARNDKRIIIEIQETVIRILR